MSKQLFYNADPDDGVETHYSAEAAKARAEESLEYYRDGASSDGWPEDMELIGWGRLLPFEQVVRVETAEPPDHGFDDWCDYTLKPVEREPAKEELAIAEARYDAAFAVAESAGRSLAEVEAERDALRTRIADVEEERMDLLVEVNRVLDELPALKAENEWLQGQLNELQPLLQIVSQCRAPQPFERNILMTAYDALSPGVRAVIEATGTKNAR